MSLLILAVATAVQAAPPAFVPDARLGLALYCAPTCSDEGIQALEDALAPIPSRRRLPRAAAQPVRTMGLVMVEDFGLPHLETLGALADGVGPDAVASLESSQEVLVVSFAAPRERITELNAVAYPAFLAAIQAGGAVVEDLTTGRIFDADAFADQAALLTAASLDTSAFFVLQATGDQDEDSTDLETVGLRALGLHDIRAESLAEDQLDDWAALINALAQLSWEQGSLQSRMFVTESAIQLEDARLRAVGIEGTVYARSASSTWSTSADPLVVIGFDGRFDAPPAFPLDSYPTAQLEGGEAEPEPVPVAEPAPIPEPVAEPVPPTVPEPVPPLVPEPTPAAIPQAQPEPPPAPVPVAQPAPAPSHAPLPPTLIETQTRSLARLDSEVRQAWDAGLPSGDRLYVKAPFDGDQGALEYLWVQVVSWSGGAIAGVLRSEPSWVPKLAVGDVVEVDQAVVFDYLWRHADGSSEGNLTEAFLD